jgi:hypothetical protein
VGFFGWGGFFVWGGGKGGEMTQTLYVHMNKKITKQTNKKQTNKKEIRVLLLKSFLK